MKKWSLSWFGVVRRSLTRLDPKLRILMWATIAGLIFGAVEFGKPLDDALRSGRNLARRHSASGDIVVVAVDDASLQALGRWPWPRSHHARMVDVLNKLGARRIFFDMQFMDRTDPKQDEMFAAALARSKAEVTLAASSLNLSFTQMQSGSTPLPLFSRYTELGDIGVSVDYRGSVERLNYECCGSGKVYPTMAAKLAMISGGVSRTFPVDYAIDPHTVPTISAATLIHGKAARNSILGKDVIIGTTAQRLGDHFQFLEYGPTPGVFIHVLGAETLRQGSPFELGWLPPFLIAVALAFLCMRVVKLRYVAVIGGIGTLVLTAAPLALEAQRIWVYVAPALFVLAVTTITLGWSSLRHAYRRRSTINATSGLPNLDALRGRQVDGDRFLIAARIHNYAQIASALPVGSERVLAEQIANRLTLGSPDQELFQGDEGIFAWFTDLPDISAVGEHLDALHGFFRNSVTVRDEPIDLALSFGVDAGGDRAIGNRLGSALVACDEAAVEGRRWKAFDPAALDDATWKLSLLGQLDRAIDTGDFWVAYQPKLDLKSGRIVGAEALARWTHPDKGAIAPLDFILAAEQSDRIEKLTQFVLDTAIGAAAAINSAGTSFEIAVNVSTRLIGDAELAVVVETLLRKHGLAPSRLTLEVTETAALDSQCDHFATLTRLRNLGVGISIDDYGTGLSTLDYLKKIPATEIKIDQSFVASVTESHRDRLMVNSTVQLAHSLGRSVVAEGVEDQTTLDMLVTMGCDQAQGFFIGRPVDLAAFTKAHLGLLQHKLIKFG